MDTLPPNRNEDSRIGVVAPPAIALCDVESRDNILNSYGVHSLEDDPELAQIVRFAAQLCETPVALVNLVLTDTQKFLAREGVGDDPEPPLEHSFCIHALGVPTITVIPDALMDARFADNPLVLGPPNLRFYAGAPLIADDGVSLGSLCVLSPEPRAGLTPLQHDGLTVLATAVMRRLNMSRRTIEGDAAARLSDSRFRKLADSMPQIAWSADSAGTVDYFSKRFNRFAGVSDEFASSDWGQFVHPEDVPAALEAWKHALTTGKPYDVEYRLRRHDGEWRWMMGAALPNHRSDGTIDRWYGTITDIHESKRLLEARDLLARELAHRIKNIFAVMTGLVRLKARGHPESRAFAEELAGSIGALGRAHDFVRPDTGGDDDESRGNSLHGLLAHLFEPYRSGEDNRVTVSGDDAPITVRSATPVAMVFHELATNSSKYGALFAPAGSAAIAIARDAEHLTLEWTERGGPAVEAPAATGFGTRLIDASITSQLHGTIERRWEPAGFAATIRIPLAAL